MTHQNLLILVKKINYYEDFDLNIVVHLEVTEEELQKRMYRYPYDNYKAELSIDDIGYSGNVVFIGVEILNER